MPLAALEAATIDYVAPADQLAATLADLVNSEAGPPGPVTDALRLEVDIALGGRLGSAHLLDLATPSPLSCPDCQGVLSEIRESRPLRYRCQVGHAFTAEVLAAHIDQVDQAVRVAMRIMEERVTLVERMADDARQGGRGAVADLYDARAAEYRQYAETLRQAAISSLSMGAGGQQEG
jgi:two-component system, chemotaxis family, protein-glutamate methylesterase/glutaminase